MGSDAYIDDDNELNESYGDSEDFAPLDPFEGLTRSEQDMFFRVLDVIPDEKRGGAIEYFMDHPKKIRAVIEMVKEKQELIKNKDIDGLNTLFEQEKIQFQNIEDQFTSSENSPYSFAA